MYRTHTCGELTAKNIWETVKICGWTNKLRNLWWMTFIDLRDRYWITQITVDPQKINIDDMWIRSEYVLQIEGKVIARPDSMVNKTMKTWEVELEPIDIKILSKSDILPFSIVDEPNTSEEQRFKYRYLDLRRKKVLDNVEFRTKMAMFTRAWFTERKFFEVQTPIFTVSSPEWARDYLIPSRVNPGKFYALPQAPQQYKQLLMVGWIDKYFQIAPCFRDEDPRADRHSCEFYQIDCEMSFVEQEDVYSLVEGFMRDILPALTPQKKITVDFQRMKYVDALDQYGSDKPDLRFGMKFVEVKDVFKNSEFSVFNTVANSEKWSIKVINFQDKILSRKETDELTKVAQLSGAKGLAYVTYTEEWIQWWIAKFLTEENKEALKSKLDFQQGNTLLFVADKYEVAIKAMNKVRLELRDKYNLVDKDDMGFVWIEDFPMFELDEETGKYGFAHNPFSYVKWWVEAFNTLDALDLETTQYDLVVNGYEMLSGSIRNHDPEVLVKVFEKAGMWEKEIKEKFGAMYEAFKYGPPPHGWFAIGFDRFMMLLKDESNIRECYAFPKSGRAEDTMMWAPSKVDDAQLNELNLLLKLPKKEDKE